MLDIDKLTTENDESPSLESILAEYADYPDAAPYASPEPEVSPESSIDFEDEDGGLYAGIDSDSAGYASPPEPEYEPDYEREAYGYTGRLRRSFERLTRRVSVPEEDEYTPEPSGEPDFAGDDDVKVYRPSAQLPDGDEDVKVYSAPKKRSLDDVVAEAERRSSAWSGRYDAAPHSFSGSAYAPGREAENIAGGTGFDYDVQDYGADGRDAEAYEGPHGYDEGPDGGIHDYAPDDGVRNYGVDSDEGYGYASEDSENAPRRDYGRAPRAKNPVLALLAVLGVKLGNAQTAGEAVAPEDDEDIGEELPANKAAKYYAGNVNSLRIRFRLSLFPMLALLWISLGLPAFGALGSDLKVTSLVCLVLELTVVMLGLDVFTSGIMSLVRGRIGMWSLVSLACIASALDAAISYAAGTAGWGTPMCAASALSMVFALYGALLEARALRFSAKARELAEDPITVTAESGIDGRDGSVLMKSKASLEGWLHRCEEPDAAESAFSGAAPWLVVGSFLLSLVATGISGSWTYFFRILAATTACAAPCAAFVACPLPYFLLALRAYRRGAAVAGWPGMRDIGRAVGMVVTDSDLFPGESVKIQSIRILSGSSPERVIADAGSVVIASGSVLSPLFSELLRRNGYAMRRVEDFCCHEGGGLTALIAGEEVLCGSAAFMRLMGIMVPQKLADRSAVFVAISGVLSGIFNIEYSPVPSVGKALVSCLRSRRAPIFAVRDFLVTPLMLHRKYGIPTDGFDFPLYAVRYAVSGASPSDESRACALMAREGLGAYMEVAGCGRRCYISAQLGTVLSLVCAVSGVLLAFALYAFGSGLSVAWLMAYMAVFTLPGVVASVAGAH